MRNGPVQITCSASLTDTSVMVSTIAVMAQMSLAVSNTHTDNNLLLYVYQSCKGCSNKKTDLNTCIFIYDSCGNKKQLLLLPCLHQSCMLGCEQKSVFFNYSFDSWLADWCKNFFWSEYFHLWIILHMPNLPITNVIITHTHMCYWTCTLYCLWRSGHGDKTQCRWLQQDVCNHHWNSCVYNTPLCHSCWLGLVEKAQS